MKNKVTVIYHRADFDGVFCREIARKFLGNQASYVGWDYGDPTPCKAELDGTEQLYMLDISIPDLMDHPRLIWIDHHRSAIEKFPTTIPGYRIDGVAACRLAWQWFAALAGYRAQGGTGVDMKWFVEKYPFPKKQDFIDRAVHEPVAVRLAGEHDIWDHRDADAELFQFGLRSRELNDVMWKYLLGDDRHTGAHAVADLLADGKYVRYAEQQAQASLVRNAGFTVEFEGLKFLALNSGQKGSGQFAAGIKPEHDALLKFNYDGRQWDVSMYHVTGKEEHDLSKVAVKYGGGGHRGACGFRTEKLPFLNGEGKGSPPSPWPSPPGEGIAQGKS